MPPPADYGAFIASAWLISVASFFLLSFALRTWRKIDISIRKITEPPQSVSGRVVMILVICFMVGAAAQPKEWDTRILGTRIVHWFSLLFLLWLWGRFLHLAFQPAAGPRSPMA